MTSNPAIGGIVPVMLTPFTDENAVDFASLERLTNWYIDHGSDALFAVCQSSEMQLLNLEERVSIARFVTKIADRRVPVVVSGHIGETMDDQIAEMHAMAETNADALIFVTNRLDPKNEGFEAFRANLHTLMDRLPPNMPLGLYECPAPYRRLLSDDEIKLCRDTGRFVALKDVSCELDAVRRRAALVEGTDFAIINANAAIALEAMRSGSRGFAGVFTNFHPDLYAFMYANRDHDTPLMRDLAVFLALAAMVEGMGYPKLAKIYQQQIGNFASTRTRSVDYDIEERHWALPTLLDHIGNGTQAFRQRIATEG